MSKLSEIDVWEMFQEHFADAFPGGHVLKFTVSIETADGELAQVGVAREGCVDRLAQFENDDE